MCAQLTTVAAASVDQARGGLAASNLFPVVVSAVNVTVMMMVTMTMLTTSMGTMTVTMATATMAAMVLTMGADGDDTIVPRRAS